MLLLLPGRLVSCKGPKLFKNKLAQGSETFQKQIGARVPSFSKPNWRKGPKLLKTKLAPSPNSRLHKGDIKKQVVFSEDPQIVDAAVQNVVERTIGRLGFLQPRCSGNAVDLHSGGSRFESRPRRLLLSLVCRGVSHCFQAKIRIVPPLGHSSTSISFPIYYSPVILPGLGSSSGRGNAFIIQGIQPSFVPTHSPVYWLPGTLSPGPKRLSSAVFTPFPYMPT